MSKKKESTEQLVEKHLRKMSTIAGYFVKQARDLMAQEHAASEPQLRRLASISRERLGKLLALNGPDIIIANELVLLTCRELAILFLRMEKAKKPKLKVIG